MTRVHPSLRFGGIKGFAGITEVPIAPITLLFGWNSAGKSTILQSLLLLKQTLEEGDPSRPSLVVNGSLTQLGSFRNLVHRHDASSAIHLGIDIPSGPPRHAPRPFAERPAIPAGVTYTAEQKGAESAITGGSWKLRYFDQTCVVPFSLSAASATDESGRRALPRVNFLHEQTTKQDIAAFLRYLRDHGHRDREWQAFARDVDRYPDRDRLRFGAISDADLSDAVEALKLQRIPVARRFERAEGLAFNPDTPSLMERDETAAASGIERKVAQILGMVLSRADASARRTTSNVVYLGPFRQPPERLVLLTGEQFADVGTAGQNTIALLARSAQLRTQVDTWLERLEIPYRLAVDPLETTKEMLGDVLVAGLREAGTDTAVGMRDVGFGVSQVLPVVVQAVTGRGTILAVEQPELHVHPKLQAQLGDLFAELAQQGTRFLLETHSEHLILRLLSWVRRGDLRPEDLAVIYVDRDAEHNSVARRLRVDDEGEFVDRWPHGFFTERRAELG